MQKPDLVSFRDEFEDYLNNTFHSKAADRLWDETP